MKKFIELNSDAVTLRKQFGIDMYSPIDVFTMVKTADDMTVVFYPMSQRISGVCIKDKTSKIIGINSSMTLGRQRFTLAHELYHLYFQDDHEVIICTSDLDKSKENLQEVESEREADMFASYFLITYEALKDYVYNKLGKKKYELDLKDVVKIEQFFGISRQAILWRLTFEGYLSWKEAEEMKTGIKASALRLGYDTKLYEPAPQNEKFNTFGKYIALAEELKEKNYISNGKYEELLLAAFKGDIVYGIEGEDQYD
ncbi:ImmA/IrrE family metallo-endopeptidase [Natranaerobius trueperi]|uniref:IrrE N-terminal-like domain-containing protein n=1 Tax=Natranaerobius trueperi TaxID=759412 RepID=A0A226BWI6_9FIRM|nr:ImmA/IrrE family metallo-endopeptidase [Natranaerobius trueperi]OWZ83363.1 hypothetical protein CDO51_09085 [Natranaerobius trueperi]